MTQQIERALQKEVMMRIKCAPIDALVLQQKPLLSHEIDGIARAFGLIA